METQGPFGLSLNIFGYLSLSKWDTGYQHVKYVHRVITPPCMFLYAPGNPPRQNKRVWCVRYLWTCPWHTHGSDVLGTCGTPYPCSDHLCTVLVGSGCAGPLLWPTFKSISVQETAPRRMGSSLMHIFFSMVENIMQFPSNLPFPEEVCFLSEEQETTLCALFLLRYWGISAMSVHTTQCKNPFSLTSASTVVKMVWSHLVLFFFLKAHFKMGGKL